MIIFLVAFLAFLVFMFLKRLTRRRNVELMGERPYRYEMDSRRSHTGWKGGF
jgi:hypothetical protein